MSDTETNFRLSDILQDHEDLLTNLYLLIGKVLTRYGPDGQGAC